MLFIFPSLRSPAHSTRLLWRGCSPETPNTDARLETPSMPRPPAFQRGEEKGKERTKKSLVPGCVLLSLWFPSTVNVNKQRHERRKHGQKRRRRRREETVSRQNISWHEAWDTSHQLIYWYRCQTPRQKAHAGNKKKKPSRHTGTQRAVCEACDTPQFKFTVQQLQDKDGVRVWSDSAVPNEIINRMNQEKKTTTTL